jgi:hypothetical protein
MSQSNNGYNIEQVDLRLLGQSGSLKLHKYKAVMVTLVLVIVFVALFIYIIKLMLKDGYLVHKTSIIAAGVVELVIVFVYFKLIHKHLPSARSKSKFTGLAAIARQRQVAIAQSRADIETIKKKQEQVDYETGVAAKHTTELDQYKQQLNKYKQENAQMHRDLKMAQKRITQLHNMCPV